MHWVLEFVTQENYLFEKCHKIAGMKTQNFHTNKLPTTLCNKIINSHELPSSFFQWRVTLT
jgi:hypothetical protein